MTKHTKYVSKTPNEQGVIEWTEQENKTWQTLITRQLSKIEDKACDEYINGLKKYSYRLIEFLNLTKFLRYSKKQQAGSVMPFPP